MQKAESAYSLNPDEVMSPLINICNICPQIFEFSMIKLGQNSI